MGPLVALVLAAAAGLAPDINVALALERSGEDLAALAALDALAKEQPAWELPRVESARLRLKLGHELERAQNDLEIARALAPESPRIQYLWGLLREEVGDPAGALRAFELAVEYRPSFDDARFRLAGAYLAQGRAEEAEAHYRHLLARRPDWTQARLQLIDAMERQGRVGPAEEALHRLWMQEGSSIAGRRLAELYERTGRPEEAQKVRTRLQPAPQKKMRPLKKSRR